MLKEIDMGKNTKNKDIKIHRAELDYYVSLKFDCNLDFTRLCDTINSWMKNTMDNYFNVQQASYSVLTEELKKVKMELVNDFDRDDYRNINTPQRNPSLTNDVQISLDFTDKGFRTIITPYEVINYYTRRNDLTVEYNQYERIYGKTFTETQERFVLPPLRVTLENEKVVWMNAILCVFANKMGILKLELPLYDITSNHLKEIDKYAYIKETKYEWDGSKPFNGTTIDEISDFYLDCVGSFCSLKILKYNYICHTILADYEGMPENTEHIDINTQEELYKIISAPVTDIAYASCKDLAKEYLKNHSWGERNFKYITNTKGGCLSTTGSSFLKWVADAIDEEESTEEARNYVIKLLRMNVELALIIMALRRMNAEYVIYAKATSHEDAHEIQRNYNFDRLYISELLEGCYGSVREQLENFEKSMRYYIDTTLIEEKIEAINEIIRDEEDQRNSKFQNFLSISGVVLALVFGLPAIHDTLSIIRPLVFFIKGDIPYVSVANASFFIWSVLTFFLAQYIFKKQKKKKTKRH